MKKIRIFIENKIIDRYWKRFVIIGIVPLVMMGILTTMAGVNYTEWYQNADSLVPHGGLKMIGFLIGPNILFALIIAIGFAPRTPYNKSSL